MKSLNDFLEANEMTENVFSYYFIFDQWIPVSLEERVPLYSFFGADNENTLDLPNNVKVENINGFIAFAVRDKSLKDDVFVRIDNNVDSELYELYFTKVNLPKYTVDQIQNSYDEND